nr:hypothetical protein [uncultured bacterium]
MDGKAARGSLRRLAPSATLQAWYNLLHRCPANDSHIPTGCHYRIISCPEDRNWKRLAPGSSPPFRYVRYPTRLG